MYIFSFEHLTFIIIAKLQSLAQFPGAQFSNKFVPTILCIFAAFGHYAVNCFAFATAQKYAYFHIIFIIIIIYFLRVFHISFCWWFFTRVWVTEHSSSLQDSFQYSGCFQYAVFWIVSTRPLNSKSYSLFNNPLVSVPKASITIGIIVTSFSIDFFNSQARFRYLFCVSHFFSFILWSAGTAKSTTLQFFCCCWLLWCLVSWPRLGDLFVYQSPKGVYVCHFLRQMLGLAYTICSHGQI